MRYLAVALAVLCLVGVGYADEGADAEEKEVQHGFCPVTNIVGEASDCLKCHAVYLKDGKPIYGLKEVGPYCNMSLPASTEIVYVNGKPVPYYYLTNISSYEIKKLVDWLGWHPEFKHVIIEIQSPGGSLFDSSRIVGLLDSLKERGVTVETRVYGFAASAGFYVFVNGSKGYRHIAPEAQLMWHELLTFDIFNVSGPSDKEDEARVLRHLQDTVNSRIAAVSNMTKAELDALIRKKELWCNGTQAVEHGFADGIVK
jgi:ATP-dependent protease ClpP protease subunit